MKLQDNIDFTTLAWVKPELDETLRQARLALENYVEGASDGGGGQDNSQIRFCATYLHQVQGTLRMVELYGAAMVAEEMEQLATALIGAIDGNREEAYTVLMRGIVQLPDYLERLQSGHRDIPIVLLPLLNELRSARGENGLSESVLFAPDLTRTLPATARGPLTALDDVVLRTDAEQLRTQFQAALLGWLRDDGNPATIAALTEVCEKLVQLTQTESVRRLFWVAAGTLDALRTQAFEPSKPLKQALARVEREIKRLADGGEAAFRSEPPLELTRQLLYFVAHAPTDHGRIGEIRDVFGLTQYLPSDSELDHARGSMSGHNRALLDTVAGAIKEDLLRVKDALDLHLRTPDASLVHLGEQIEIIDRVADTLGMLGLGVPRRVVQEQRHALHEVASGARAADESALLDIAGALLYVEATLDDQVVQLGNGTTESADNSALPSTEAQGVLDAVIKEAIANFAQARQCFIAFVETSWDHAQLADVPRLLDEVAGALRILELDQPPQYVQAIRRFTETELLQRQRVPNGQQMDTLADALAGMEYFLEALGERRGQRDRILDVVRQSLALLGYWPPTLEAHRAPLARVPTGTGDPAFAVVDAPSPMAIDRESIAASIAEPAVADTAEHAAERAVALTTDAVATTSAAAAASVVPTAPVVTPASGVADTTASGFDASNEDIDDEIREVFLEEFAEEIDNLAQLLPAWRVNPENMDLLRPIRRVFHTLKGSGRLVGAHTLGEFSWKIESMLNRVLDGSRPASPAVLALFDHAANALPQLHAALRGEGTVVADIEGIKAVADRLAAGEDAWFQGAAAPQAESVVVDESAIPAEIPAQIPTPVGSDTEAVEPTSGAAFAAVSTEQPADDVAGVEMNSAAPAPDVDLDADPNADADAAALIVPDALPVGAIGVGIDAVLFEILKAEVDGHLATVDTWLVDARHAPRAANDPLLRAVHTMNGAFAMTEVPLITDVIGPLENYIKRLLAHAVTPDGEGVAVIAAAADAVRQTMRTLEGTPPHVAAQGELPQRVLALRDSLPEPLLPSLPAPYDEDDEFAALPFNVDGGGSSIDAGLTAAIAAASFVADAAPVATLAAAGDPPQGTASAAVAAKAVVAADETAADTAAPAAYDADGADPVVTIRYNATYAGQPSEYERFGGQHAAAIATNVDAGTGPGAVGALAAHEQTSDESPATTLPASGSDTAVADADTFMPAAGLAAAADASPDAPSIEAMAAVSDAGVGTAGPAAVADAGADDAALAREREYEAEFAALLAAEAAEALVAQRSEVGDADAEQDAPYAGPVAVDTVPDEPVVGVVPAQSTAVGVDSERDPDRPLDVTDVDLDLLDVFLEESVDLLDHSSGLLAALRQTPSDRELVTGLQRDLHTLKGGARMVGVRPIGDLGHAMESLLETIAEGRRELDPSGVVVLERGFDRLHGMVARVGARRAVALPATLIAEVDALARGVPFVVPGTTETTETTTVAAPDPAHVAVDADAGVDAEVTLEAPVAVDDVVPESLGAVDSASEASPVEAAAAPEAALDTADAAANDDAVQGEVAAPVEAPAVRRAPVAVRAADAPASPALPPLSEPLDLDGEVEDESGVRGPQEQVRIRADLLDRLVNYAGEVAIYRSRMEQQVGSFRGHLGEFDQTTTRLREQLRKLEIETEAQIIARYQRETETADRTFDPLELDRFSTLQQLSRALNESAADLASLQGSMDDLTRQYETLLLQQSRVSSDLQQGLMRTRMVPFDSLVPRLRRVLRQAASETGKQVQLKIDGAQGDMDRNVLERMTAPLEHMLRNAIAHGVETPQQRRAAGKPEEGTVRIAVQREGSEVVLRIIDDGRGLDGDAIRRKAIQRGLLKEGVAVADFDLYAFILEPGFSTAETVSQLAGRGVGMDVVHGEIRQLGGSLQIRSEIGQGSEFIVRLPFTLAVTQAVFVKIGETSFAVPIASVQGVGRIARAELETQLAADKPVFAYAGEDYAIHDLGRLLGQAPAKAQDSLQMPLLLIRSGELRAAIAIDQVLGSREIVVKPVGPQISSIPGIFGATIMGDGSVVVILDVTPLVRRQATHVPSTEQVEQAALTAAARRVPLVMVVDDSITMRKVTGRVLERHSFEVLTAKDGVDAVEKMVDRVPDLMLLDIEMPRMDGYELATLMRNDARLRGVPIIMITSRTGEKHRQRALDIGVDRYLGKPYQEHELMRNVFALLAHADSLRTNPLAATSIALAQHDHAHG